MFVTQQIDCPQCFERVFAALRSNGHVDVHQLYWPGTTDPLGCAGRTKASYPQGDLQQLSLFTFTEDNAPCHMVSLVVVCDGSLDGAVLQVSPSGEVVEKKWSVL